jgi:hypothetical protein
MTLSLCPSSLADSKLALDVAALARSCAGTFTYFFFLRIYLRGIGRPIGKLFGLGNALDGTEFS